MMTLALSAALACLPAQDAPPPHPKFKIDFALGVSEKDGFHVFTVQGKTELPDEAVLKARVYVVTVVPAFTGPREDEEPLVWADDEGQPAFRTLETVLGVFKDEVYKFLRPPWPLRYRARIHYEPRDQPEVLFKTLGEEPCSWAVDLQVGDAAAFSAMLAERVVEVREDLLELKKDFDELRSAFRAQDKARDEAAWKAWKDGWYGRIERRFERNQQRYGLWAVWLERQSRMRVGGLCELSRRILGVCGEHLFQGMPQPERIRDALKAWIQYWEEAGEVVGVDLPLDADQVGPPLADYEKAVARLREAVAKGDEVLLSSARRDGLTTLMKLPPMLRYRKRGYVIASELTARFSALLEAAEAKAPADVFRAALEEEQSALKAFKDYAGLSR